jgi:hypothetical protein
MPSSTPSGSTTCRPTARLATVYLDDDNVRALLPGEGRAFTAALDRIRGRRERGVKAFARSHPDLEADHGAADTRM